MVVDHPGLGRLPSVTAVVATYNRKSNLPLVLAALLDDPATSEIVVVVDGCRDGSYELLEGLAAREPRLKPVFIENRGPNGAHQAGVEVASGEVVLLLADDVIACQNLVTGHARQHARRAGLVVVGYMPTLLPPVRRAGGFATYLYAEEYERCCVGYERDPSTILRNLWGGNVSLRRRDCALVPIYTESFKERYHEDQEWGIRCLKAGLTGVFDRSLRAKHLHSRPLDAFLADCRREGAGRVLLYTLHADLLGPLDRDAFAADLPVPAQWMVQGCRGSRVHAAVAPVLHAFIRLAGVTQQYGLEESAARLARRIEQQSGALEFVSNKAKPAPPRIAC